MPSCVCLPEMNRLLLLHGFFLIFFSSFFNFWTNWQTVFSLRIDESILFYPVKLIFWSNLYIWWSCSSCPASSSYELGSKYSVRFHQIYAMSSFDNNLNQPVEDVSHAWPFLPISSTDFTVRCSYFIRRRETHIDIRGLPHSLQVATDQTGREESEKNPQED